MTRKSGSFLSVLLEELFLSADTSRKRGSQKLKSLALHRSAKKKNRLKRTSKKNCYFGTCIPANNVFAYALHNGFIKKSKQHGKNRAIRFLKDKSKHKI